MGLKVSLKHPSYPDGEELDFMGVAPIPNGGSVELTDEQEAAFVAKHGMTVKDAVEGSEIYKVSGSATVKEVPQTEEGGEE